MEESSDKENVPPESMSHKSRKKRKQARIVTDDDLYEFELKPELFESSAHKLSIPGARQLRVIRQRKKAKTVKFSDTGKEQEFFKNKPPGHILRGPAAQETKDIKPPHISRRRPYVPEGEEIPEWAPHSPSSDPAMIKKIIKLLQLERSQGAQIIDSYSYPDPDVEVDNEYYYSDESEDATEVHIADRFGSGDLDVNDFDPSNMEMIEGVDLDGYTAAGPSSTSDLGRPQVEHVEQVEAIESSISLAPNTSATARSTARTAVFALTASEAHKRRRREAAHPGRKNLALEHENASNFNLSNAFSAVNMSQTDGTPAATDDLDAPTPDESKLRPGSPTQRSQASEREREQTLRRSLMPRLRAVDEVDVADTDTDIDTDTGPTGYPVLPEYDYGQQSENEGRSRAKGKGKEGAAQCLSTFDTQLLSGTYERGRSRCRSVKWDRSHTRRVGRDQARRYGRWAARSESCRRGRARERSCS